MNTHSIYFLSSLRSVTKEGKMEELVEKIDELIITIQKNSTPLWLTWVSIVVPIILSIVVIICTILQHKQNKNLQKTISTKEIEFQMHGEILKIYSTFEDFHDFLIFNNNLTKIVSNKIRLDIFVEKINQFQIKISHAYNHVKLIFNDDGVLKIIGDIHKKFFNFVKTFNEYYTNGQIQENNETAWKLMESSFSIKSGDYVKVYKNTKASSSFEKIFKDKIVVDMEASIKEMIALFSDENFDDYFSPYVKIGAYKKTV